MDPDPDPYSDYGSGFSVLIEYGSPRIRIRSPSACTGTLVFAITGWAAIHTLPMYECSVCNFLYVFIFIFQQSSPTVERESLPWYPRRGTKWLLKTEIFTAATVSCKIRNLFALVLNFHDVFYFLLLRRGTSLLDFLSSVLRTGIHYRVCLISEMQNRMTHFSKT